MSNEQYCFLVVLFSYSKTDSFEQGLESCTQTYGGKKEGVVQKTEKEQERAGNQTHASGCRP